MALLISTINGYIFWWLGLSALIAIFMIWPGQPFPFNSLSYPVIIFISALLFSAFITNPALSADGMYYIAWFGISFVVFSRLPDGQITLSFRILLCVFILLAVWALFQYLTGTGYLVRAGHRANTIFYTANTFAAALNLALLPMIVRYVHSHNHRWLLATIAVLFAALLVTQSRGGVIAFSAAMVLFLFIYLRVHKNKNNKPLKKLLVCMAIVFALFSVVQIQKAKNPDADFSEDIAALTRAGDVVGSLNQRLMIYQVAWDLIKGKPLAGYGYMNFQYYWQRDQHDPYIGSGTRFVHNDYLQILMETGLPGLLSLLCIILVLYYQMYSTYTVLPENRRIYCVVITIPLTAYFIHALVDFVMYPPVLLLLFGAYMGIAARLVEEKNIIKGRKPYTSNLLTKLSLRPAVVRGLTGIVLISWLAQPAIAQLAFDAANRRVSIFKVPEALPLYELARRFAPSEPEYYRYEAALWAQAVATGQFRESAELADQLFAKGAAANPFEVENLFSRAVLNRDHAALLEQPAEPATILEWMEYVLSWQPHNTHAQAEYLRTLFMMGKTSQAELKYKEWKEKYPDSIYLRNLAREYGLS